MNLRTKTRLFAAAVCLLALGCSLFIAPIAAAEETDSTITTTIPSAGLPSDTEREDTTGDNTADDSEEEQESISFPDVTEEHWFYSDVMRLVEQEILHGYPDGGFHPEREISNAEFVKILMISIGTDVSVELDLMLFSEHWASIYISLAYKQGIITDDDLVSGFDPSAPITRSAMTKMMILALGIEPARIDDPFTDISDIYASTAYNEYLLRGYLLADGTRIYDGAGNALRSEAAAIIVRVLNYREDSYEYKKEAILSNAAENKLNTESELIDLFYILNREFMSEFSFMTDIPFDTWKEYYRHANVIYLEYFYTSSLSCTYDPKALVSYNVTLEYTEELDRLKELHDLANERCEKFVQTVISDTMSEMDKVKAVHDYLVLNCAYDYNSYIAGTIPFEARLAYGALCDKSAVCQGYAAAFNMLCKRVGIRSVVVTGTPPASTDDHAWNMVLIDGQIYHVDVTHDDPVPDVTGKISYRYYMLSDAEMEELGYVWDKTHSNLKYFY